jgi:cytochrome P450
MSRLALRSFTFSNGMTIPAGTLVAVPASGRPSAAHRDERIYANPDEFDGFRFAKLRESEGEAGRHQMISTSTEFLVFFIGTTYMVRIYAYWVTIA